MNAFADYKLYSIYYLSFVIFVPQTPKIIRPHKTNCKVLKLSPSINTPASTDTTVIILENDDERIALMRVVE